MDTASQAGRCIYTQPTGLCPGSSKLNDEHYLPRGLGNFRDYSPLKDTICEDCNSRFSNPAELGSGSFIEARTRNQGSFCTPCQRFIP
jgi:hypothetical protein